MKIRQTAKSRMSQHERAREREREEEGGRNEDLGCCSVENTLTGKLP